MGEKLQVTPREVRALLFDFGGVLVDLAVSEPSMNWA